MKQAGRTKLFALVQKEELMASRRPTAPTRKHQPTPLPAEKAAPARKATRPSKSTSKADPPRSDISEDMRRGMIAQAAYLRAERRGFAGGTQSDDWLAAEAEVDALLRVESGGTPQ